MCDILWADPCNKPGRSMSKRGVSIQFGEDVTRNFLERNNLGELEQTICNSLAIEMESNRFLCFVGNFLVVQR